MDKIIKQYLAISCLALAGDFAAALTDKQAKHLHDYLMAIGSEKLVRTLWYSYKTQSFRWSDGKPICEV